MPDEIVELKALFDKPPKEVVEYFEAKIARGPKQHWDWSDTLRHSHDRAFTVSKATSLDLVKEVKAALQESISQGLPYQQFAKTIIPKLKARGWWGKGEQTNKATGESAQVDIGHRRLRQIYNVNMRTAYDAGKHARMMEHAELTPYWRYRSLAPGPNRREAHQRLNNLVFRYDDPFWATHKPSNGWGCKCDVEALDKRMVERIYKRPVDEVVKKSSPDDFATKTVRIQNKDITVVGYKAGGTIVYPDAGWDYSPGDYAWRSKQMLAAKIQELPASEARNAFMKQMKASFAEDFKLFVRTERALTLPRNESVAVGIMDEGVARVVSKHLGEGRKLQTDLLLASDKALNHMTRSSKESNLKEIAMPRDLVERLPELIVAYKPYLDKHNGLLYLSPPFNEGGKIWHWKIVFEAIKGDHGNLMTLRTATKVENQVVNLLREIK